MRKNIILKILVAIIIMLAVGTGLFLWISNMTVVPVLEDYQGPILPLSITSEDDGIEVDRTIEVDYSDYYYAKNYYAHAIENRAVKIKDEYVLKNTTNQDRVLKLAYGFVGDYETKLNEKPTIYVNDKLTQSDLIYGRIDSLNQIETVETDGETSELSENVKVYEFESLLYDGINTKISFEVDTEQTILFYYGFTRMTEKKGVVSLEVSNDDQKGYILVMGADIHMTDSAYAYETRSTILDEIFAEIINGFAGKERFMYIKQDLADMKELDFGGSRIIGLEPLFMELFSELRVNYCVLEITVPANGNVTLKAEYDKPTGIKKIKKTNYDGLEIITEQETTLHVVGADHLTFSQHTTGEALENGEYQIQLSEGSFQIYNEVPKKVRGHLNGYEKR